MKFFLQYLFLLNAVAFTYLTSTLNARQSHMIETNRAQSAIDSAQIPQALHDFIAQAIKQGLSIDQIVEQAIKQGYPKDQVVSAYSVVMVQEVDEASSTQNTLMWCMLGAAAATTVGVGAWLAYKWLMPETITDRGPERQDQDGGRPRVIVRALNIVPVDGAVLPDNGNQRVNQLVEQRLAEGRNQENIIQEVRELYPDMGFEAELVREIRGEGVLGRGFGRERYPAWNNYLRDRQILDRIILL